MTEPQQNGTIPERYKLIFDECMNHIFPDIKGEAIGQIILELGRTEAVLTQVREALEKARYGLVMAGLGCEYIDAALAATQPAPEKNREELP